MYPWTSFFAPRDVRAAARAAGLEVLHLADDVACAMRDGMRQRGTSGDWHEWLIAATPDTTLPPGALRRLEEWAAAR